MEVITRRTEAARAAADWRIHYADGDRWKTIARGSTREVYDKLVALGSDPLPGDVNSIIGNESWTEVTCDECSRSVEAIVRLGQAPDYESSTAEVCFDCLRAAWEHQLGGGLVAVAPDHTPGLLGSCITLRTWILKLKLDGILPGCLDPGEQERFEGHLRVLDERIIAAGLDKPAPSAVE